MCKCTLFLNNWTQRVFRISCAFPSIRYIFHLIGFARCYDIGRYTDYFFGQYKFFSILVFVSFESDAVRLFIHVRLAKMSFDCDWLVSRLQKKESKLLQWHMTISTIQCERACYISIRIQFTWMQCTSITFSTSSICSIIRSHKMFSFWNCALPNASLTMCVCVFMFLYEYNLL